MLSYQHAYHAGNLADVHKHGLLAWMLSYLTRKDKPLSYMETHAGRGLYDLSSSEAVKTGEAARGIVRHKSFFDADHPYSQCLDAIKAEHGAQSYPGSPLIAASLLRVDDSLTLAELHPQEHAALADAMLPFSATARKADGFELALSMSPPTPRRGILLCDPSFEVKDDYRTIPDFFRNLHRRWPVGILALWYPILAKSAHREMIAALGPISTDIVHSQVAFPPARKGHGMVGSGLYVINPPYGLAEEAARIEGCFAQIRD